MIELAEYAMTFTIDDATVTVDWIGEERDSDFHAYRMRYDYVIQTPTWQYVGDDIRSGCSAAVDVADAARTLFGFLAACAESRAYPNGENADLFPDHVGAWAEANSDELSMLSMGPEYFDA